jgi:phosphoserine phosphatase
MKNRYRVEIYDANKMNDVTIYSDSGVDKEYLTELVFSNLRKFSGRVNAYVFDNVKKKKTTAMFLDENTVSKAQMI